jgi:uncharacterized RDD family membrane protein YckC
MNCPTCAQADVRPGGYCQKCGGSLPSAAPAIAGRVTYAGFWKRVAAYFIDAVVLNIGFWGIGTPLLFGGFAAGEGVAMVVLMLVILLSLIVPWLYFAMMESSPKQATLGKLALNIRVTDLQGQRISFGRASGRFWGKIISGLTCYIGLIMAAFTERKQALHDMMASCLVVNAS